MNKTRRKKSKRGTMQMRYEQRYMAINKYNFHIFLKYLKEGKSEIESIKQIHRPDY